MNLISCSVSAKSMCLSSLMEKYLVVSQQPWVQFPIEALIKWSKWRYG